MKKLLIALTALTLAFGTASAASFRTQEDAFQTVLAAWHTDPGSAHFATYSYSSLSEVVGGYWQALHALGYRGSLVGASAHSTTYVFEGEAGALEARFSQSGEEILASISRPEARA